MPKNKKTVGRPKKEFISKKPKTKIKSGPGRPRKDQKHSAATNHVSPAVASFVAKSVDDSKRKDTIILLLFFLSFLLFVISLYFTFIRDKKAEEISQSNTAEITNIATGNIDYTSSDIGVIPGEQAQTTVVNTAVEPTTQTLTTEQQMIIDFYKAVNTIDIVTLYTMTDDHLKQSNVFVTYYSKNRLSKFSEVIVAPKIVITNIQETPNTTNNPNIKNFTYTLEYMLAHNQQKFTEERSTVLIKKGDIWKIGKLLCETKGCSTMPFFNPDKYK
ncbi:MAG: hypothetical protein NT085_03385 [candidate division SR1 bacterium]|nr:hypothetical protein [candidate division SR1 bacterium]